MKFNSIVVAILAAGLMIVPPAFAGGKNGNNGQGNNCQGNSCGGGSNNGGGNVGGSNSGGGNGGNGGQGGAGGNGGNGGRGGRGGSSNNTNNNRNTANGGAGGSSNNTNRNTANGGAGGTGIGFGGKGGDANQAQGQGQAQGQLQGQGQAQGQAIVGSGNSTQGQAQAVVGSGNSAQGQSQGLNNSNSASNAGQSNAQSSNFVNNNTNAYLPERINPMPTIDYGNARIGDVVCPVPGILGGVSYSDGNYGFDGYGQGSDVTATLGFQIPLATNGCREEQTRVRAERARVDSFNLIRQCLAIQQTGVKLDATVFPEFNKCEGVNPVSVVAPQVQSPVKR
jgi:hypothetical protein